MHVSSDIGHQKLAPTIGWYGTWNLSLGSGILDVWSEVAERHTRLELSALADQVLDRDSICIICRGDPRAKAP